jgi:hypothetical protein
LQNRHLRRGKLLVDGVRSQTPGFQVHAVAHNDDAIEGQAVLIPMPSPSTLRLNYSR